MPYQFQIGARCAITKQTTRADRGWHVVVKSVNKEEMGNQATLACFADEIGAIACASAIKSGDVEALASLDDSILRELPGVAKGSMPSLTSTWRSLFDSAAEQAEEEVQADGMPRTPPSHE